LHSSVDFLPLLAAKGRQLLLWLCSAAAADLRNLCRSSTPNWIRDRFGLGPIAGKVDLITVLLYRGDTEHPDDVVNLTKNFKKPMENDSRILFEREIS
jgi:hypothetical protein